MLPERWRRVEQLYRDGLGQPPTKRAKFLAEACGDDQDLLREVESLLAQEDSPTTRLTNRSPWEGTVHANAPRMELHAGAQIGPYKLEVPIGAGGMGQVF